MAERSCECKAGLAVAPEAGRSQGPKGLSSHGGILTAFSRTNRLENVFHGGVGGREEARRLVRRLWLWLWPGKL